MKMIFICNKPRIKLIKHISHKGFTLAEVLLTLMIIGVVGAITIPGFIAEHQEKVYVTSFKKFYSAFNNNMNAYLAKNGCTGDIICSGILGTTDMTNAEKAAEFEKIVPELFPGAQKCNPRTNCMPSWYKDAANKGSFVWNYFPLVYSLPDGVTFLPLLNNSSYSISDPSCPPTASRRCGIIAVDVNGKKGPNIAGRDLLGLALNEKGNLVLSPQYSPPANIINDCHPTRSTAYSWNGVACGTRLLRENWEMNY